MKTGKKLSRTSIYMIIAVVVLLLVNASLGFLLTIQSGNSMKTLIRNRMLDVTNTAADMLDGDVLATIQAEDESSPEYQKILRILTYYQDNIDLKYIYCIRDSGNGNFIFTIDPTTEDPAVFGEPVVYTDALYEASKGTPSVDREPYEDAWGRFYSSYSPVFDSKGNVAGIVAADFSADWYDRQISNLVWTIIIITVLSLSVGLAIVFLIASRLRKRIHSLYTELNSLSDGIEDLATELSGGVQSEGSEILHNLNTAYTDNDDDVKAVGEKIQSLQKYMRYQIDSVRAKAYRDGLTGLENRTAYLEYIADLNTRIQSHKIDDFVVAMFDINGLKETNDRKGHDGGDDLILAAVGLLKSSFEDARIFRIGGDEFVVIMDSDASDEKLFEKYNEFISDQDEGGSGHILSMGYSRFDSTRDLSFEDTFTRADRLMYENKKTYYSGSHVKP